MLVTGGRGRNGVSRLFHLLFFSRGIYGVLFVIAHCNANDDWSLEESSMM